MHAEHASHWQHINACVPGTPAELRSESGHCSPLDEKTTSTLIASIVLMIVYGISMCGASQKRNADMVFTVILGFSIMYAMVSNMTTDMHTFFAL